MRTVCVAALPVLRTLTWPGGPVSGTARTSGAFAGGGCERSRRRRTASVTPAAAMVAAASKKTSAPGPFDGAGFTWNDFATARAAA